MHERRLRETESWSAGWVRMMWGRATIILYYGGTLEPAATHNTHTEHRNKNTVNMLIHIWCEPLATFLFFPPDFLCFGWNLPPRYHSIKPLQIFSRAVMHTKCRQCITPAHIGYCSIQFTPVPSFQHYMHMTVFSPMLYVFREKWTFSSACVEIVVVAIV